MSDVYGEYFDFEFLQLWKYELDFPPRGLHVDITYRTLNHNAQYQFDSFKVMLSKYAQFLDEHFQNMIVYLMFGKFLSKFCH